MTNSAKTPLAKSARSAAVSAPAPQRLRTVRLSIVLPAYNEALRLPRFLDRVRNYVTSEFGTAHEVLVVDDGSTDATREVLCDYGDEWSQLRALRHLENRGKGAAVRTGVLAASGDYVLFSDADGATPILEERTLRRLIDDGAEIAVGKRTRGGTGVERTPWRGLVGAVFARSAKWSTGVTVGDPQCGFKMFGRRVAKPLFEHCAETGYLFDLFVLALALEYGFNIREAPVTWQEVPGSKVRVLRDGWKMWRGLRSIRNRARQVAAEYPVICNQSK